MMDEYKQVHGGFAASGDDAIFSTIPNSIAVHKEGELKYGMIQATVTLSGIRSDNGIVFALTEGTQTPYWENYGTSYYFFFLSQGGTAYLGKVNAGTWTVCGEKAIFSNWRFAGNEIPEGHYRYDIRTDSEGNFCTIEPFVVVDYGGTIITKEPIGLGEEGYFVLNEDDSPNFLGEQITLDEFAKTDFTEDEGMEMQL
jgi:hypothetical protein